MKIRATYQKNLNIFKNCTKEEYQILLTLIKFIKNNKPTRILDVGAGTGNIFRILKSLFPQIHVIGIEPYLEIEAKDTYDVIIKEKVEHIDELPQVDLCVVSHVLGHIPQNKHVEVLKSISEKTDVIILITNALYDKFSDIQKLIWKESGNDSYNVNVIDIINELDLFFISHKFTATAFCQDINELYAIFNALTDAELSIDENTSLFLEAMDMLCETMNVFMFDIPQFFFIFDTQHPASVKYKDIDALYKNSESLVL